MKLSPCWNCSRAEFSFLLSPIHLKRIASFIFITNQLCSLFLFLSLSFLLWNAFLSNSFSSQDRKRLTILWYVSIPITEFYARFIAATSRISYTRVSTLKLRVLTETDQEKIRIGFQATESFVVR